MAIDFQQTDDAAVCAAAAFCSALSLNGDKDTRQAVEGGTAGVTGVTTTFDASAADLLAVWFEIDPNDSHTWDAGDYTIRLNVGTGNHQLTWDTLDICRVNSSCVNQASIASAAGLAKNLANAGVYTHTIAGAAQTPAAGDKIMVILGFDNAQTMTNDLGWTPDQLITTPLTAGGGAQTISPTGIASTLAFGTIQQLARTLTGITGIASTEAHGGGQLNLQAEPSSLASTLAFGTAAMQPGPVTISPVGIASALAFGTPTMQPGPVTVSPSGIASTLAFGTPTVTVAALTISPSGIASGVAFGTARLDQQVTPAGIAGGLVFGTPSVAALISPTGIASSIAFGAAQLNQEITPAGIASAAAVGEPTMQPGSVTVSPSGIASTLAFGSPTMTASIGPSGIASTLAFGTAAMQPGPATISPGGIASSLGIGSLTVSVPMTIRPDGISSTVAFGLTIVSLDVRGVLTGYVELAVSLAGTVAFATALAGKAE